MDDTLGREKDSAAAEKRRKEHEEIGLTEKCMREKEVLG